MESLSLCCYGGQGEVGELCREYAESIRIPDQRIPTLDWRDKATAKFDEESQV